MTSASATNPENHPGAVRRYVRWMLLNRRTGHLTVAQFPNISLSVFVILSIALRVLRPMGEIEGLTRVLADTALFAWAIDEVLRGVNPFRRLIGFAVIVATCVTLSL